MSQQPWTVSPQAPIVGQTCWIDWPVNLTVSHADLTAKLQVAGLDASLARSLCAGHAFRRAVKKIVPDALKDRIEEKPDVITFQLSDRIRKPGEVDYVKIAVVSCDKLTGSITCADPVIETQAIAAFNAALGMRHTADVTRLVNRAMGGRITRDIFKAKGTFFVLPSAFPLIDAVEKFVVSLNGTMTRWDLADGTVTNSVRVQTVIVDNFSAELLSAEAHIETITRENRPCVVKNAEEALEKIEANLRANARRIGDELGRLEDYLALCRKKLEVQAVSDAPFRPEPTTRNDGDDENPLPLNENTPPDEIDVYMGPNPVHDHFASMIC